MPVKEQDHDHEHHGGDEAAEDVHQDHGHHALDGADDGGADAGHLTQAVGVEEAHGHALHPVRDGDAAVGGHEVACVGLVHFGVAGGDGAAEDAHQLQDQRQPSGLATLCAAGQCQHHQVNGTDLAHLQDRVDKADCDGFIDIGSLVPGKLPDFLKGLDHSASPSFAPIWACHISLYRGLLSNSS